jgi:hypothetical protein
VDDEALERNQKVEIVLESLGAAPAESLSEILCLRHTMANERSQYARTQEQEAGGGRHHAGVDQA